MKNSILKVSIYTFVCSLVSLSSFGQVKEDQDCFTTSKRILCVSSYTEPNGYKGTGNDDHEIPYKTETGTNAPGGVSCFPNKQAISGSAQPTAEIGSAWYYFIPDQSGNLRFTITSLGSEDFDWVIYNLSTAPGYDPSNPKLSCGMIYQNNNLMMVGCNDAPKNAAATTGAINTGTNDPDNDPFSPPIYVNKGDFYVICVNNFTGNNGFSIDFSTSDNIFDITPPTGDASTANISAICTQTSIDIKTTELVKCAEVDADGSSFQLVDSATNATINSIIGASPTNCKGTVGSTYTDAITVTLKANAFPGIGTYYLKVKNGTDANTFSDLCPSGNYAASGLTISTIRVACADFATLDGCVGSLLPVEDLSGVISTYNSEYSWSWDFGDPGSSSNTSTIQNPYHAFSKSGTFTITETLTKNGVPAASTITNTVDIQGCGIYFPTAFNPNSKDDSLKVYRSYTQVSDGGFKNFKMTILNRWGQIVFSTTKPSETWDGKFEGKEAPEGVYAVIVTGTFPSGGGDKEINYKGTVSIVK